jgi:hypothetical protein
MRGPGSIVAALGLASLVVGRSAVAQAVNAPVVAVFPGNATVAYGECSLAASPYDSNQAIVIALKKEFVAGGWLSVHSEYIGTICGFCEDIAPTPLAVSSRISGAIPGPPRQPCRATSLFWSSPTTPLRGP